MNLKEQIDKINEQSMNENWTEDLFKRLDEISDAIKQCEKIIASLPDFNDSPCIHLNEKCLAWIGFRNNRLVYFNALADGMAKPLIEQKASIRISCYHLIPKALSEHLNFIKNKIGMERL